MDGVVLWGVVYVAFDHQFVIEIMSLVNEIELLNPVYNKWYMDDGGIIADVETLKKVWHLIKSRGPELGLHLNSSKCEWSWLNPECKDPCPISVEGDTAAQIQLVPHSEIQMLGVPLGSFDFVAKFVDKKLIGRLQNTVNTLVDFEDSQAAMYLLRVSFSIVRAVHFMRTTPLEQWKDQASKFDGMVRDAAEKILGRPMSNTSFAQACLTPKLGGLGLRKVTEHAGIAYNASWHEAKSQCKEDWLKPEGVDGRLSQKEGSFAFDKKMYDYLVDNAPTEREKQRLMRLGVDHASAFITAVPSDEDGKDTVLRPRNFRIAVLYRLGVPVLASDIPCPLCKQQINIYGDHATCCANSGDIIIRHNTIRNFVDKTAGDGLLSPVLEKQGILGHTDGRRPGDVTIPIWSQGKGLCIDVAVTSPLAPTNLRLVDPCNDYAERNKITKYGAGFKGTDYEFCPVVLETLGAISTQGEDVLRQLFRFAAKRLGQEFSSYCGRSWARLSCNLQRCVSQSILTRIDCQHSDVTPASTKVSSPAQDYVSTHPAPVSPSIAEHKFDKSTQPAVTLAIDPVTSPVPIVPPAHVPAPLLPVQTDDNGPNSTPLSSESTIGGIVAIKADGHCCYHLAGVIGALCVDSSSVANGRAACSDANLHLARSQVWQNFTRFRDVKLSPFYPEVQELEKKVFEYIGETTAGLKARVTGTISGKELWGSVTDLALYTLYEDVRVVVINADSIVRSSSDRDLLQACTPSAFEFECEKFRVVCAVLSNNHWDLGVVYAPHAKAVFQNGSEWDTARSAILRFLLSHAPEVRGGKRTPYGLPWQPPDSRSPTRPALRKAKNF